MLSERIKAIGRLQSFAADRMNVPLLTVALFSYASVLVAASVAPVSTGSALGATANRRMVNNVLHIPAYGVLAWLSVRWLRSWARATRMQTLLAGSAAAIALGVITEVAQRYVPGRSCSALDLALNTTGVLTLFTADLCLGRWTKRVTGPK